MSGVLAVVMAGGEGTRLMPLTVSRSKPAVPFAGSYRLIDFVLNNFVNSNILKIYVLTQFKSQSLYLHLKKGWNINGLSGCFIDPIPAQMRLGKRWYDGTADSVFQNLSFIQQENPDYICVFGSDHIYKMDVNQMLNYHKEKQAVLTIAAIKIPISKAKSLGVIEVDKDGRMVGFEEKPSNPHSIPGDPEHALVSMGNYIFDPETLYNETQKDNDNPYSVHDFGRDIIPEMLKDNKRVFVYDFSTNVIPGENERQGYWRDVGDIDTYWQAHMDILSTPSKFSLYNPHWPLHTYYPPLPPVKFRSKDKSAVINNSIISAGCYIKSATITHSVLGFECNVGNNTSLENVIIIGNVTIGDNCRLKNTIIDRDVSLSNGTIIGEEGGIVPDNAQVSANGIIVIRKGTRI
ncbi:MAG: glucose-1-phosphate adenylyltransferase [Succinivibrionaceae bacterium]|nr:glucose-1-phosphate adenylyltransferase [Succinivibrionaceae bacterium]